MEVINAEKAQNQLGEILNMAETNPVAIQGRNGYTIVLLSKKRYEIFEQFEKYIENMYWTEIAEESFARNNWVGPEKSEIALQEMLNAND